MEWGRNWRTSDRHLNIDTLKYNDKTLRDVYNKIRNREGRTITKDSFGGSHFVLEGTDRDGSVIYVEAYERGSEIRGLSIVYTSSARTELVGRGWARAVVIVKARHSNYLRPPLP